MEEEGAKEANPRCSMRGGSVSGSVHLRRRQVASLCPFLRLSFSAAFFPDSVRKKKRGKLRRKGWLSTKTSETLSSFQRIAFIRPRAFVTFVFYSTSFHPLFLFHAPRPVTTTRISSLYPRLDGRSFDWQDFPPLRSIRDFETGPIRAIKSLPLPLPGKETKKISRLMKAPRRDEPRKDIAPSSIRLSKRAAGLVVEK